MNDHVHERQIALDSEALRRLLTNATPRPWLVRPDPHSHDETLIVTGIGWGGASYAKIAACDQPRGEIPGQTDAELIAAAINALPAILAALTERDGLRAALCEIRDTQGRVCGHFDCCDHPACASSYAAWAIADAALTAAPAEEMPDARQADREERC